MRTNYTSLWDATLILLIVTIGMLNVGLGFGLAMYFGYGPPGLDGIFQALGPMPSTTSGECVRLFPGQLGVPYVPGPLRKSSQARPRLPRRTNRLAEDGVLSDIRDMAAAAQGSLTTNAAQARE